MTTGTLYTAEHVASRYDDRVYRHTVARMFRSRLFEPFSRVHPSVPAVLFAPVAGYFLYAGARGQPLGGTLLSVASGVMAWTLVEYLLHRFVFHLEATSELKRFLHFYTHGIHHSYPDDPHRLVMVPMISVPMAVVFYVACWALLPAAVLPSSYAGLVIGYLVYDYSHWAAHHVTIPRSPWLTPLSRILRVQRMRHMRHHYGDSRRGYGVSTGVWDIVFHTSDPVVRSRIQRSRSGRVC